MNGLPPPKNGWNDQSNVYVPGVRVTDPAPERIVAFDEFFKVHIWIPGVLVSDPTIVSVSVSVKLTVPLALAVGMPKPVV